MYEVVQLVRLFVCFFFFGILIDYVLLSGTGGEPWVLSGRLSSCVRLSLLLWPLPVRVQGRDGQQHLARPDQESPGALQPLLLLCPLHVQTHNCARMESAGMNFELFSQLLRRENKLFEKYCIIMVIISKKIDFLARESRLPAYGYLAVCREPLSQLAVNWH